MVAKLKNTTFFAEHHAVLDLMFNTQESKPSISVSALDINKELQGRVAVTPLKPNPILLTPEYKKNRSPSAMSK
jgi:hypothetical protein